jgi:uncharacterized protein (DUF1778 family)
VSTGAILLIAVLLQQEPEPGMALNKTATLTLSIEPNLKEALRRAAELEHRSIVNMVEVMIMN